VNGALTVLHQACGSSYPRSCLTRCPGRWCTKVITREHVTVGRS